ncbi:uncharacterized protein LOC141700147 [Apium graveolens]|uniref:uncharacterized protein LOC141700147 n=1 Tax=Apium graveolens TaxID=4045 RepID=UPI003D7B6E0B
MQAINAAISKLKGCVCQVENQHPSGVLNEYIKAKLFLKDDPKISKRFKFGHVWHILKDCEKFFSPNTTPHVQCPSSTDDIRPNLSAFDINSTDEEIGATSAYPVQWESKKFERNDLARNTKEENKILLKDLNSIFDPNLRELCFVLKQTQIMEKKGSTTKINFIKLEVQKMRVKDHKMIHNYNQYYDYLGGFKNHCID